MVIVATPEWVAVPEYVANEKVTYTCHGDLELTTVENTFTCNYEGVWIGGVGLCGKC